MDTLKKKQFVVIDDNPNIPIIIEHLLNVHEMKGDLHYFTNPLEAIPYLKKGTCDLLFLDIDMPQMNGFDMLKELDYIPDTIILTAYSLFFAEKTFDFIDKGVIDHVSKSRIFEKFGRIKERFLSRRSENALLNPKDEVDQELVLLVTEYPHQMTKLNLSEIKYFKQENEYTYISTYNSFPQQYRLKQKLSEVVKWVSESNSFQISKYILIMLDHVVEVNKNRINMGKNDKGENINLNIAFHRRAALIEKLKERKDENKSNK